MRGKYVLCDVEDQGRQVNKRKGVNATIVTRKDMVSDCAAYLKRAFSVTAVEYATSRQKIAAAAHIRETKIGI